MVKISMIPSLTRSLVRPGMVAAVCLLLAGCGSLNSWFKVACAKPGDFAGAIDNPPLKIPPGRDAPDTRSALTIPPLDAPEAPRPADNPCIDTPPKFTPAAPNRPQA